MSIILGALTTFMEGLAVASLALQGLKSLAAPLLELGKELGLIEPETDVEDLGDKAIQSDLKPDDFDCYEEYLKAVEDYKLDPEKSKLSTEEKKIQKGIELTVGVMIDKYQDFSMDKFINMIDHNQNFFTEAKMGEIAKVIKMDGQSITDILHYVDGTEKNSTKIQGTVDTLLEIEKNTNPGLSDKEAFKNVMELRQ
ncbi:hypothetical protein [Oribacterium sinus]|jgi:hypothetical protein|uniref:Uncharacterized protein n=1 Tax=Oribacterium sinus F0268 TaxID=585501 RepID=C2KZ41_9FIRM|nr:hypothetical protein [Oribacterium sinus]EEJ50971.1 hypothetical protein HMPREF6123_1760 [Oribacterium sinus F0268]